MAPNSKHGTHPERFFKFVTFVLRQAQDKYFVDNVFVCYRFCARTLAGFRARHRGKIKNFYSRPGRWLEFRQTAFGAVCARKTGTPPVRVEARCAPIWDFGIRIADLGLKRRKRLNSRNETSQSSGDGQRGLLASHVAAKGMSNRHYTAYHSTLHLCGKQAGAYWRCAKKQAVAPDSESFATGNWSLGTWLPGIWAE